ncbi:sulfotransferase [Hyphococcus flavus]|uniref:Sulfotransferase n=1 Tax=Hyphococcus flavus TaxID=1866326 RepID=A0AAF0CDR8_9PROT|nr:tetratricopeptide repeat-containing sulfotransferase family protein [Hyphococcus flavus]WDI30146.1 sulfotransferase [Hyphococcus flavus]
MSENEENLKAARASLRNGEYAKALGKLRAILTDAPQSVEALFLSAVCLRYLNKTEDAFHLIAQLKAAAPEFGRAYQEEGHLFKAQGESEKALKAYQQACVFNPALEASWRAQSEILLANGHKEGALKAKLQAEYWAQMPKPLIAAANHLYEGRLLKAEELCRAFMQQNPRHVEGMRLLAEIGARFSVFEDAEFLLESALTFEPENLQVRLDYIKVLRKRQKYDLAHEHALKLYNERPDDPFFQSQLAVDSMQLGDFKKALSLFDRVLTALPDDAATLVSRGHAFKTYGRHQEAVQSYRAACKAKPALGDAYYGLANLKTYRFSDSEISEMRAQVKNDHLPYASRIQFCFSLGKALEDRRNYEESFAYYKKGNDLKRKQCRYDADQMTDELHAIAASCDQDLFIRHGNSGCPAQDPIFIVGLPRAGSTLIEQILASHSLVDGTFELPNILALAHRLRRTRQAKSVGYPENLPEMSDIAFSELGEKYIEGTKIHRQNAPYFIDKMPNNFRHIGLISLILPNAKIIDARREPMACCFSGFKQLFAEGQEFTYGLTEIGRYYHDYVELMSHWNAVLPGKVLRVQHEDVLDDLEGQVKRILEFCALPFEHACVEYHKTERSVRTASSEQVRQPINKSSVSQWQCYEPYLGPLKYALGKTLTEYQH